jgi:glycosyltransferase involved in cell wall biosynthesis
MTMKKVAMIGPELYPIPPIRGGASELFIEKACHSLTKYQPFIFSPADPELSDHEIKGIIQYHRIFINPLKKIVYSWFNTYLSDYEKKISSILKKIDPDIIHIHNRPLLVSFFKNRFPQKKVIFHMHNLYNYLGKREKPYGEFEIPSDLTIACSRFILESEKNRLVRGSIRQAIVYNGVDTESFLPSWVIENETKRIRKHYGLNEKKVVLYTGKIRESKGVGLLVRAMEDVFQKEPDALLVLTGGTGFGYKRTDKKTEFSQQLRKKINAYHNRILFLGFIPPQEMPRIYLLGDIFVAPSQLEEGMPLVFLEAASCGLPVIGTRLGGTPESLIEGKTGILLKEKDNADELTDRILFLLKYPEYSKELGKNGRIFMERHFSWSSVAKTIEELYDSLLS